MTDRAQLESDQRHQDLFSAHYGTRHHESTSIKVFNAPAELVFKVFTEAEHLVQWWQPEGYKIIECNMDLQTGGLFHYNMQSPVGGSIWGRFVFHEIIP